MSREVKSWAAVAVVVVVAAMAFRGGAETAPAPTPAPTPAPVAQAPQDGTETVAGLVLAMGTQLAADKGARVLYVSRNAPRITLYDTEANHPWCHINGKPAQIAQAGDGGFTCYRWTRGQVAVRVGERGWAMYPESAFLVR